MSNIETYVNLENTDTTVNYSKINENTKRVQKFAQYLHDFLPILEEEFNDLENLQNKKPNRAFPIKMEALSNIYKAAKPLYEWYVEKAKRPA